MTFQDLFQCFQGPIYMLSGFSGTFNWLAINEVQQPHIHFITLLKLTVAYIKNTGNRQCAAILVC